MQGCKSTIPTPLSLVLTRLLSLRTKIDFILQVPEFEICCCCKYRHCKGAGITAIAFNDDNLSMINCANSLIETFGFDTTEHTDFLYFQQISLKGR